MHFLADFRDGGGVFAGFEGAVLEVGDVLHRERRDNNPLNQ